MVREFLGVTILKRIVRKAYWNYEKEEKWLNEMAAKGLALTDYSWCRYVFSDCMPGEYTYRIELLKNSTKHPESQRYINFMEENGVEHVASYMRWIYFRRKASEGAFDIYSDIDSKITHYKRIGILGSMIAGLNLLAGLYNLIFVAFVYVSDIYYPYKYVNILCCILSLILSALLYFGLAYPNKKKIRKLKEEQRIRE